MSGLNQHNGMWMALAMTAVLVLVYWQNGEVTWDGQTMLTLGAAAVGGFLLSGVKDVPWLGEGADTRQ